MGKISPVSAKYLVHAQIQIDGVVERPDVVGAIFGQTEGLLGSELELRELQRSGKIGRIEVNLETKNGKTSGVIILPSSLDKAETSIIAAAIESIQKIGPCESHVKVEKLEDVRVSKRAQIIERAKELLKDLTSSVLPESQELTDEVASAVRVMEATEYGVERLPAGPQIDEADELIVVEGRADVLNLLKHGIKNTIALNGTNVPETIKELGNKKTLTLFVDGDRGGDLIIKEVSSVVEVDYVTKAPDGKEVEELTKKEIHKALRSKIAVEQAKMEFSNHDGRKYEPERKEFKREISRNNDYRKDYRKEPYFKPRNEIYPRKAPFRESAVFKKQSEELVGTRGAYILDKELNILGKVPVSELTETLNGLNAFAVVLDGEADFELIKAAEHAGVCYMVVSNKSKLPETRITVLKNNEL